MEKMAAIKQSERFKPKGNEGGIRKPFSELYLKKTRNKITNNWEIKAQDVE